MTHRLLPCSIALAWALAAAGGAAGQSAIVVPIPPTEERAATESTRSVGFSPRGTYVWAVAPGKPDRLFVWTAADRKLAWSVPVPLSEPSGFLPARPAWAADESAVAVVAAANRKSQVRILDAATGSERKVIDPGPKHADIRQLLFTPDGKRLLVATGQRFEPNQVVVLDLVADKPRAVIETYGREMGQADMAVSPDGRVLATVALVLGNNASADHGSLKLWDIDAGTLLGEGGRRSGTAYRVAFRPGGKQLVTAQFDGTVRVWDVTDPKEPDAIQTVKFFLRDRDPFADGFRLSADGRRIGLTGGNAGRAVVLPLDKGEFWPLHTLHTRGGGDLSPDATMLVTGGNAIRLWPVAELTPPASRPEPRVLAELDFDFDVGYTFNATRDGSKLVIQTWGGAAALDAATGRILGKVDLGRPYVFNAVMNHLVKTNQQIGVLFSRASGGETETLFLPADVARLLGADIAKVYACFPVAAGTRFLFALEDRGWVLADDQLKKLASGEDRKFHVVAPHTSDRIFIQAGKTLSEYSPETGEQTNTIQLPTDHYAFGTSPDCKYIFGVADLSDRWALWRMTTKTGNVDYPFAAVDLNAYGGYQYPAVAVKSERVATLGGDGFLRVWNGKTGASVGMFPYEGQPRAVAFSPDGTVVYAIVKPSKSESKPRVLRWELPVPAGQ